MFVCGRVGGRECTRCRRCRFLARLSRIEAAHERIRVKLRKRQVEDEVTIQILFAGKVPEAADRSHSCWLKSTRLSEYYEKNERYQ